MRYSKFVKIIEIRYISPISPPFSMFLSSFLQVKLCESWVRVWVQMRTETTIYTIFSDFLVFYWTNKH